MNICLYLFQWKRNEYVTEKINTSYRHSIVFRLIQLERTVSFREVLLRTICDG